MFVRWKHPPSKLNWKLLSSMSEDSSKVKVQHFAQVVFAWVTCTDSLLKWENLTQLGVAGCSSSGRGIHTNSSRSCWGVLQGEKDQTTSVQSASRGIFLLLEVFLLFIKKSVFHGVRAVCVRVSLAGTFVFLNGFVQGVQLTQQWHIQLPKANLKRQQFKQSLLQVSFYGSIMLYIFCC